MTELNHYEIERLETENERLNKDLNWQYERVANKDIEIERLRAENERLQDRAADYDHYFLENRNQGVELRDLYQTLIDLRELVDGRADVDAGQPNLAMQVYTIVTTALGEDR